VRLVLGAWSLDRSQVAAYCGRRPSILFPARDPAADPEAQTQQLTSHPFALASQIRLEEKTVCTFLA
jgi:hypothetical protein